MFGERLWFKFLLGITVCSAVCHGDPASAQDGVESTPSSPEFDAELAENLQNQFEALWRGMTPAAKRGYRNLVSNVYLPHDFDEEVVREISKQSEASLPMAGFPEGQNDKERFFARFGLAPRHDAPDLPLQYAVTKEGRYVMNCFACHGGNLFGATYPGSPNSIYQLESLTEIVRKTKLQLKKPLGHMDIGSLVMPLGRSIGTSNAVMFGVALMNYRDADLNIHPERLPAAMTHHDMDAPPWWHFHRKDHIYIDGFAEKGHKGLMQFMLVKQNGPEKFRGWENDFRDVYAFLQELRPPKYPYPVDASKSERGEKVFAANCASCHGTYRDDAPFPNVHVPIDEIGTDRVRWESLTPSHRAHYGDSWFGDYGGQKTLTHVDGYVAPPLDGIWASAPYLHNGSVPTLWHLLHPDERPVVWRRTSLMPDREKVGFQIETMDKVPRRLNSYDRRLYFDTTSAGKSASGHDFPGKLSEGERSDLLEYLKTL